MVIVYVAAGLANRMFHYAFALSLAKKGWEVGYDENTFVPHFDFETTKLSDVFENVNLPSVSMKNYSIALQRGIGYKILRRLSLLLPDHRYIERWKLNYDSRVYDKCSKNSIFLGHWNNYKYFSECESEVRKTFQFRPFEDDKNISVVEKMDSENSVAVHFRKNIDYICDPENDRRCSPIYYQKAISYILEHVDNPKFYFFSDNWDWVRKNIKIDVPYTKVDWNPICGSDSFRDMQLMSCCKHNIIANSTYSWWGAWLNANPDKIVIAPQSWFQIVKGDTDKYMCPDNWLKF